MKSGNRGAAVRAEAATVVDAVACRGRSLDAALAAAEDRVDPEDRPMLRMLSYGALRSHWRLRGFIKALVDRPLKPRDSVVEALLAVGLFQMDDSRVPDHAAVTLTVEAVRRLRKPKFAPLVNAVLRNFRRKNLAAAAVGEEQHFNHPAWLIEMLRADWPDHWQRILEGNDSRAPMWLRVNKSRMSRQQYAEHFAAARATVAAGETLSELPGLEQALCLAEPLPVAELPGFAEGQVSVQDGAAQLAAPWLLADAGLRVLDACAAPGGKTAHLLELMRPPGSLTAIDKDSERLQAVARNLGRLGLTATLKAADASRPGDWWDGERFDRILLDAPCSATGVIRRHPDIKLLRRPGDIENNARLQRTLLSALWPLLAPDGRLLYVTCSVLSRENESVAAAFLRATPDAYEEQVLPDYNIRDLMHRRTCGFQTLPGERGLDGFYFAALRKRA